MYYKSSLKNTFDVLYFKQYTLKGRAFFFFKQSNLEYQFILRTLELTLSVMYTKRTKKWANYFLSDYKFVYNFVPKDNKVTIKWLKWLGFEFSDKEIVVRGVKVLYFYKYIQRVYKDIQPLLDDIGPLWITDLS